MSGTGRGGGSPGIQFSNKREAKDTTTTPARKGFRRGGGALGKQNGRERTRGKKKRPLPATRKGAWRGGENHKGGGSKEV